MLDRWLTVDTKVSITLTTVSMDVGHKPYLSSSSSALLLPDCFYISFSTIILIRLRISAKKPQSAYEAVKITFFQALLHVRGRYR